MMTTTLNKIRACKPCSNRWAKLLKYLGKTQADDEPLPFSVILDSNGLDDALWCCRSAPEYDREWRLFAVLGCARQVQHLMTDQRSIDALDVAERYAYGEATEEELKAAGYAAEAAWAAAGYAARAARAARAAAGAAARAAGYAARDAAGYAARAAAEAAGYAARAARAAAWDAAWDAARDAARDAQTAKFREIIGD